jgi:cyclin B
VTKWGRTSQRTSTYKARDISNATGGTMTTRTGEPASKRESYTAYLQGRVATVCSHPHDPSSLLPDA